MRKFHGGIVLLAGVLSIIVIGCEIDDIPPQEPDLRPASTPVINEVFALPFNHQNTFWWIEIYNPTPNTVDLTNWTLSFTTIRIEHFRILAGRLDTLIFIDTVITRDTLTGVTDTTVSSVDTLRRVTLNRVGEDFFNFLPDTGIFDVRFAEGVYEPRMYDTPEQPAVRVSLLPNGLFTIVNNKNRLEEYTEWGTGDSRLRRERPLLRDSVHQIIPLVPTFDNEVITAPGVRVGSDTTYVGDTLRITITDSLKTRITVDTLIYTANMYAFVIQPKDQLLLKTPAGEIVDVVRMGDSTYTNVIDDSTYTHPLLGSSNRSIGSVPEFESIARFVGGYFTGNTANDFYRTWRPTIVPIPHGYSTVSKGQ